MTAESPCWKSTHWEDLSSAPRSIRSRRAVAVAEHVGNRAQELWALRDRIVLVVLAGATVALADFGFSIWATALLTRTHGFSVADAGSILGACMLSAGVGGGSFQKFGVQSDYWKETGVAVPDKGRFAAFIVYVDILQHKVFFQIYTSIVIGVAVPQAAMGVRV